MSPAFSSTRQAGAFALLLLALLLLPILVPRSVLPPREQVYASLSWNIGPYPFIHQQIYHEKSDIDIAIIGSSHIWCAVDAPYLQQQLSEKLGRPAVVISLCWPWSGFDCLYFIARDLLQNRKVHMLVFSDASGLTSVQETPHRQAWRWFRFEDDAGDIAGLPWRFRLQYYYGSILGMPRNLISLLRPNLAPVLTPEKLGAIEQANHWTMATKRLGSLAMQVGYDNRPDLFTRYTPETATQPSDVSIYSPQTADKFRFERTPTTSIQIYFARRLAALAQEHGTRLTSLNMPMLAERRSPVIQERFFWPEAMQADVSMLGIAPSTLFEGMSDADILKLYWDSYHLNENGQQYFTRLVAPGLMQIYDTPAKN